MATLALIGRSIEFQALSGRQKLTEYRFSENEKSSEFGETSGILFSFGSIFLSHLNLKKKTISIISRQMIYWTQTKVSTSKCFNISHYYFFKLNLS